MPFIYPHLALMPDAHLGKGATVGSVIPTLGAIIPAAVGVDIGCGMMAVRTQFTASDLPAGTERAAQGDQQRDSAVGRQLQPGRARRPPRARVAELEQLDGIDQADAIAPKWRLQLGSLGSGNHFIEVSLDEADKVWLFLHSGSRGVGNKLAQKHIKIAQAAVRAAVDPAARSGSRVPRRGRRRSSGTTSPRCAGLSGSRTSTAKR